MSEGISDMKHFLGHVILDEVTNPMYAEPMAGLVKKLGQPFVSIG